LASTLHQELISRGYQVNTRENELAPIVAFTTGSEDGDEALLQRFEDHQVVSCRRGLGIRLSPHLYCTEEDVERLLECV
jgi:selenocysteine lyase/cysteine desulfurase